MTIEDLLRSRSSRLQWTFWLFWPVKYEAGQLRRINREFRCLICGQQNIDCFWLLTYGRDAARIGVDICDSQL